MARLPLSLHPDARLDALDAYEYYSDRSSTVADAFREELLLAGNQIQESPELWPNYILGTKRYLMKKFPYVVVYRLAAEHIEIIAVAHGRRKPGFWQGRV